MAVVDTASWVERVRAGDVRALARAITAIENGDQEAEEILRQLFPHTGHAYLVGITGAPGAGKSSLVDKLAAHYRQQGKTVGIIAVDPTSPFTGGAILGDRIRMQNHATDSGIYIRSMATRGFLGGLARATRDAALLLDAAGKEIILVETVGVGQDEVDIVKLADATVVLLVPGMGDDVQTLKAGIMEIGDLFVINKADRGGAERLVQEVKAMLSLSPKRDWTPLVFETVATEGRGVPEVAQGLETFRQHFQEGARRAEKNVARWHDRLMELLRERLMEAVVRERVGEARLKALAAEVARRATDPYSAVREILAEVGLNSRERQA